MKNFIFPTKMKNLGLLGCLVNGALGFISHEMCMMDLDDRLNCVLDPLITRDECTKRDCCYDSNVPDGFPHCYFALEVDSTDVLQAEMKAKPLALTSGVYISKTGKMDFEDFIMNVIESSDEVDEEIIVHVDTCNISVHDMDRCGRRGVPRQRCFDLGCCWNTNWRPGGMFGARCHKPGIADDEHSDDEHSYANGKFAKQESLGVSRNLPITPPVEDIDGDIKFMQDNLQAKIDALEAQDCKPNHSQIQCIQGVTERKKCDISEALNMGIEPCEACVDAGCCFDPEPQIMAGMIYPICFEYGPISGDILAEFNMDKEDEIPDTPIVSDDDFINMITMLDSLNKVDEEVEILEEKEPVFTEEEMERRRRWERWQEIQGLGFDEESSVVEIGTFPVPESHPGSPIVFPGHNPTIMGQESGGDFAMQQKHLEMMKNQQRKPIGESMKLLLANVDPKWAQFISADGKLKLDALDVADSKWQATDPETAKANLYETIKNSQKNSNTQKYGSPELPPKPATTTTAPATTTTKEEIVTRPTMASTVDTYKRHLVEQQLATERRVMMKSGLNGEALNIELAKRRITLERNFGLTPAAPATTITTTTTAQTPIEVMLNKNDQLNLMVQNAREVLISQGYAGDFLELELEKHKRRFEASLGINITTTRRITTTTTTTTTTPQRTLPFVPKTPGSQDKSNTCFPTACGNPTDINANLKKIVGGVESGNIKYWPWQASLRRSFTDDPSFYHLCGASLISDTWILTAAHCFIRYTKKMKIDVRMMEPDSSKYLVHLGRYTKNGMELNMQPRALSFFIAHTEFHPWVGNQMHDIAVAKLHRAVDITEYVRPVCLPQYVPPVDEKLFITGWGNTKRVGPDGNKLKELILPLASQDVCRSHWKGYFNSGWICTDPGFMEDACAGDSGGPAVSFDKFQKKFTIVGVTIAGSETCSTSRSTVKPGVYSNVLFYRDFIDQATNYGCR